MSIAIPLLDLMFFLTETQENPRHVGAVLIFERPRRGGAAIVRQVVAAYRRARPVPPFNRVPVLWRAGLPEWQEVREFDRHWHVGGGHAERRGAPARARRGAGAGRMHLPAHRPR